ncbi:MULTISPECIES: hypothetical protein [Nocardia]|uniref:hypothetical protein n=1 Tax=Nocardia TaxID=1817 RepID=UPI001895DF71|nr:MULTISPECIES: hypothetical protein [Nocardia]
MIRPLRTADHPVLEFHRRPAAARPDAHSTHRLPELSTPAPEAHPYNRLRDLHLRDDEH